MSVDHQTGRLSMDVQSSSHVRVDGIFSKQRQRIAKLNAISVADGHSGHPGHAKPSSPCSSCDGGGENTVDPVCRVTIYNDRIPPSQQPRTPQNLPEARHQSRILGIPPEQPSSTRLSSEMRIRPMPGSSRTWRIGTAYADQRTPGFRGLYEGLENE